MDISVETICDWLEGRLDADETARVTTRVEQDRDLAAQVEWLRRLLEDLPQFRIADPPPELRARLEALFDKRESKSGAFDQYRAELVSDSWNEQSAAGMRGSKLDEDARHLLFSCQLFDVSVTLRRYPGRDRTDLKGQILAPGGLDLGFFSVELACEAGQTRLSEADDTGEFQIPKLSEGEYRLTILGPGYEVSTPAFNVH